MQTQSKASRDSVYLSGTAQGRHIVIGTQFGASLIAFHSTLEDAIDEWDERFGERLENDLAALADYPGADNTAKIDAAHNDGALRTNDGGTTVWVDHYEWFRESTDAREAMRCFLGEK